MTAYKKDERSGEMKRPLPTIIVADSWADNH